MTDGVSAGPIDAPARRFPGLAYVRARAQPLLHAAVALWIFSGSFVIMEPSPYEVVFVFVLPLVFIARVGVHRQTLGLFLLLVFFTPFAFIGAFQAVYNPLMQSLTYVVVTIFLLLTSYVIANYVADAPFERMRLIIRAYVATALVSATIGILAYLHILPGYELFELYGRAKAAFQDPNVFGPFLILPALYALERVLLERGRRVFWASLVFAILFFGVFVSFSRAAWGSIVLGGAMTFVLCFMLEANARQKVRMLILAIAGVAMLAVMLAGLLSIPSVGELFETRASLEQNYDTGSTGRFGRQGYAFKLALEHPLGIGPLEFRHMRVTEEPHDTYVNVLHIYGWGGGLAYYALVVLTLWRGFKALGIRSENRLLMIPLLATYLPLAAEAAIIDTDHWRHYFLVVGLIWGVAAGYSRISPLQRQTEHPVL